MKTFNLTFNKSNWSGEEITVEVTEFAGGFDFTMDGEEIRIADKAVWDGDGNPKYEFVSYDVWIGGERSEWKVGKLACDDRWDCMANGEEDLMSRRGAHPAEAVVKVLCNIM